jgi:hypothetical protein
MVLEATLEAALETAFATAPETVSRRFRNGLRVAARRSSKWPFRRRCDDPASRQTKDGQETVFETVLKTTLETTLETTLRLSLRRF